MRSARVFAAQSLVVASAAVARKLRRVDDLFCQSVAVPDDIFTGWVAESYDSDPRMFDAGLLGRTVAFLAEVAGRGPALEFGIGTGRVALPLSRKGIQVHGIDL